MSRREPIRRPSPEIPKTDLEDRWLTGIGLNPVDSVHDGGWTVERDGLPHLIDSDEIDEDGEGALLVTYVDAGGKTYSWRLTNQSAPDAIWDFRVDRGQIDWDE